MEVFHHKALFKKEFEMHLHLSELFAESYTFLDTISEQVELGVVLERLEPFVDC